MHFSFLWELSARRYEPAAHYDGTLSVFFVSSFLPTNFNVAAYAHAHALQYFVIMYTLAGDRQQGNLVIRLGALSLLAVVGYYISIWLNDEALLGGAERRQRRRHWHYDDAFLPRQPVVAAA